MSSILHSKRFLFVIVVGTGFGLAAILYAQTPPGAAPTAAAPAENAEEAALRATLIAYATAYKQGDVEKLLGYWSKDAEHVDDEGNVTKGKEAIAKLFREEMAVQKPENFKANVTSLRILRNDLAMVDGTVTLTVPNGVPEVGVFNSLWTKVDGQWQILSVRDLPNSESDVAPPGSKLQPLERLIGEWVYTDKDTTITIKCRRANMECFLLVEQTVMEKGVEKQSLTIVIGWDPQLGQIRSWVFDSAGGFGDGLWQRRVNEWFVESSGVRADGRSASSVNHWHFIDDNTLQWTSTDREIDGEAQPDLTARYVRRPAK